MLFVRILIIVVKMNHTFPFSTNECYDYTNLETNIHVLTPKSASRQPTQKSYKNRLLF